MKLSDIDNKNGWASTMTGGAIGPNSFTDVKSMKGLSPKSEIYKDKKKAQEKAKRMNKALSPGEKKHYRIKFVVAEVKNGKYTGK